MRDANYQMSGVTMNMGSLPKELTNRVFATGFNPGASTFLLVETPGCDVKLRVLAPGMSDGDLTEVHNTLRTRLEAALVGLDDNWIVEVIMNQYDEPVSTLTVVVNDPGYKSMNVTVDLVSRLATSILETIPQNYWRSLHTLREWESLVAVEWDEPSCFTSQKFTLTVPANVGLARPTEPHAPDPIIERIKAMVDREMSADVNVWYKNDGMVEVTLSCTHNVATELVRRTMFVLGTLVKLKNVHSTPIVTLDRPFSLYQDDGSEPSEQYEEY